MHQESENQIMLFKWVELQKAKYPMLSLMFHIPNGGKRGIKEAVRFKKEGVKAGVPDIFLAYPNKIYHGLFIEMKAEKGKTSDVQNQWINDLRGQGYNVLICYNFEQAKSEIMKYIRG